jgi:hypothetical protein
MPLTLSDEDKLDDTNSLEMLIKQTYHCNFEFEMHDVLQNILIVDPDDSHEHDIIQVNNMYKDYRNIIIEIRTSNRWYRLWALSTEHFEENLMLTQKFLVNHCSQCLYKEVLTEYDYDAIEDEERGGPTFFIFMINEFRATTEDAAKVLEKRILKSYLQTIEGENVKKANKLLLSGIHFLEQVNRLPSDIVLVLIKVFQTSSVDQFNNMFAHLENGRDIDQMLMRGNRHLIPSRTYSYSDIILLVVNKHQLLCTKFTWNGVSTTGTDSRFMQDQSWTRTTPVCWNCGGQHTMAGCGRERNSARIWRPERKVEPEVLLTK